LFPYIILHNFLYFLIILHFFCICCMFTCFFFVLCVNVTWTILIFITCHLRLWCVTGFSFLLCVNITSVNDGVFSVVWFYIILYYFTLSCCILHYLVLFYIILFYILFYTILFYIAFNFSFVISGLESVAYACSQRDGGGCRYGWYWSAAKWPATGLW